MNFLYTRFFFLFDLSQIYVRVFPLNYPTKVTFLNLGKNFLYHFLNTFLSVYRSDGFLYNIKRTINSLLILISFIIINVLKLLYIPLIVIFYFSKYRFIQINHYQIGTVCEDLHRQVKNNYNRGYKSIILIPKLSKFSFVKKIFKELIIIDNIFLNIILLPMKHTSLISCKFEETNINFNSKLMQRVPNPWVSTIIRYRKKYKNKNIHTFNEKFTEEMRLYFKKNHSNLNISRLIIFHHREEFYERSGGMRGSHLATYRPAIKYLLSKNYSIIRLSNSNGKKFSFNSKKYVEINTDLRENQLLQFYVLSKCKGFVCSPSGPGSLGPVFDLPCFETNLPLSNVNGLNKKSIYILKKVKLKNKIMPYKELFKIDNYFQGVIYSQKWNELGFKLINNTSKEILEGIKEFIKLIENSKSPTSKEQKDFNKLMPNHMDIKWSGSNISKYFIKKNSKLF